MTDRTPTPRANTTRIAFEAAAGALCLTIELFLVFLALIWGVGLMFGLGDTQLLLEAGIAGALALYCGARLYGAFRRNLLSAETQSPSRPA